MRSLALTILTMGIVLTAGSAQAQRYDPAYPVCLNVVSHGTTPYYRCSYVTIDQCRAFANGQSCSLNPYYVGATAPVKRTNRAPPGPPSHYRAAPRNNYNEPYFGAAQGYAPGEKQRFLESVTRRD
jgi:hypothetical protein